jgi:hypothetical protein
VKVAIPTPLRSYTAHAALVEACGATVRELLAGLDRHHPGIRFRMIDEQDGIRPHVKIFVNREPIAGIDEPLAPTTRCRSCRRCPAAEGHVGKNMPGVISFWPFARTDRIGSFRSRVGHVGKEILALTSLVFLGWTDQIESFRSHGGGRRIPAFRP